MTEQSNKSIFSELWDRRVPQFVATYIGICWGILQFLIFASNRYNLNGNYIDKFLIFAVVLLPAVFIFIYNHGKPGRDKWKSYEKILIPVNFILALVFAGLFTGGNEINAAPVEVQVTNELGDTITRFIPASSQTKSFAVFPMINESGNEEDDWLKFVTARMIRHDLEQDMRMYCISPYSLDYSYKANNSEIRSNDVAFSKYLKIAKDKIADYFIIGSYIYSDGKVTGKFSAYETVNGELFFEKEFNDEDMYSAVDDFTKELSSNLFLKESATEIMVTDLPVKDLLSGNAEALKQMTIARNMATLDNNILDALPFIDKAAELDNTSPMILSEQASYYYSLGKADTAIVIIENAIDLSESLPERQKFTIRQQYYIYKRQMDKNVALLETWRKLYPKDYYPYNQLINYYRQTQVFSKAKEIGEDAVANGHGSKVLKRLAGFEITAGNFGKAEDYINQYYEFYPDKNRMEDTQLAEIYLKQGDFDKALQWYEQIELINPNDYDILSKLSEVYVKQFEFEKAELKLQEALAVSKILEDTLSVYRSMMMYYFRTGEADKFADIAQKHFDVASPEPKISSAFQHLQLGGIYANFNQFDRLDEIAQLVETHAPQFLSMFQCVVDFIIHLSTEEKEKFKNTYSGDCKRTILTGTPTLEYLADGFVAKMDGDYKEAIRLFETYIDTTGQDGDMYVGFLAECYRLDGQIDKAIEVSQSALKTYPSEGSFLLQLAKCYADKGKEKEALDLIKKIKETVWKNSDDRYIPYKQMLDLEAELNS